MNHLPFSLVYEFSFYVLWRSDPSGLCENVEEKGCKTRRREISAQCPKFVMFCREPFTGSEVYRVNANLIGWKISRDLEGKFNPAFARRSTIVVYTRNRRFILAVELWSSCFDITIEGIHTERCLYNTHARHHNEHTPHCVRVHYLHCPDVSCFRNWIEWCLTPTF